MQTQSIEVINEILLNDLKIERNKEIELYYQDEYSDTCNNFMKIVNINGKVIIFTDPDKISIEKWEGKLKYDNVVRKIEEVQDELKEKAEKEYQVILSKLKNE